MSLRIHPCLVFVGQLAILASCKEQEEHEYRAQLAKEGGHLVLHAADVASPEFEVLLEGKFTPSTGCPQFDLTATLNGVPLTLEDGGGLRRFEDSDRKVTTKCALPSFLGSYDSSMAGPDELVLELKDASGSLRAVVRAPEVEEPTFALLQAGFVAAGSVREFVTVPALVGASIKPSLLDAAGISHALTVLQSSADRISVQIPDSVASGPATISVFSGNWAGAPQLELCEGPMACNLRLGASVGDFVARSLAVTELEIVQGT